nr:glycerophosphodiester phosphodiesterase [Phytoactinopolyspora alkaliphila]
MIGHRGTPSEFTENTVTSLRNAEALGADGVEFDVRLTRDGVPVLLHDADLNRIWGRPDQLADVDFGDVSDILPSLADVLDAVSIQLVVDCKGSGTVQRAIPVLRDGAALDRSVFIGQHEVLREVRAELPDARLALSWAGDSTPPAQVVEALQPEIMNVRWRDLDPSVLGWYRSVGLTTWWTYTIDDANALRQAVDLGFTGLITNDLPGVSAAATKTGVAG